jgi:SAM-dependent methyltransferase
MAIRDSVITLAKRLFSPEFRGKVVRFQRKYRLQWPRMGSVTFGDFYRVTPISPVFGIDRGFPIERYYIEKFLEEYSGDIKGHCLELGDAFYIKKFGGDRVSRIDVLHYVEGNREATIVADLTCADHIPSDTFDCIILTQTLQMIYDMKAALRHLHRIIRPGGVLLMTSHGMSKIGRRIGRDDWGEYWHITTQSAERLFEETFPGADIAVGSYGNVLSAMCALHGIVSEEIDKNELDYYDPDFEVIVTARVVKRKFKETLGDT